MRSNVSLAAPQVNIAAVVSDNLKLSQEYFGTAVL